MVSVSEVVGGFQHKEAHKRRLRTYYTVASRYLPMLIGESNSGLSRSGIETGGISGVDNDDVAVDSSSTGLSFSVSNTRNTPSEPPPRIRVSV